LPAGYNVVAIVPTGEEREISPLARDFFSAQSESSAVKTEIVTKYFGAWANIIARQIPGEFAYVDLFSGPGATCLINRSGLAGGDVVERCRLKTRSWPGRS